MAIPCARCNSPLPGWELATADRVACIVPAAQRITPPVQTETALEGEAACFDHPGKRAIAACRHCGRFVCALCSVEFGEEVWCPSCVTARAGDAQTANPDTSRVLYDSIAVLAPWLSFAFWPVTIVTGPGTVVFSILKWNKPLSLVRRSRWRFVLAIATGLAETAGWVLGIGYVIARVGAGGK